MDGANDAMQKTHVPPPSKILHMLEWVFKANDSMDGTVREQKKSTKDMACVKGRKDGQK